MRRNSQKDEISVKTGAFRWSLLYKAELSSPGCNSCVMLLGGCFLRADSEPKVAKGMEGRRGVSVGVK